MLCTGDVATTRSALAASALAHASFIALPARPDMAVARILAARDCDALVDGAGLASPTVPMLAARPARRIWALAAGLPPHGAPLVQRTLDSGDALAQGLAELRAEIGADTACGQTADALATQWDAAVRAHREGDLAAASAGYASVLAAQPGFAPALKLQGEVARAEGDAARARGAFAAAIASAPEFVEARLAAAELALDERAFDDAARLAREGLSRAPGSVALWRMLARAEVARRAGDAALEALHHGLAIAPADADLHFQHGVVLQTRGDAPGAARAYQRALTFAPTMVEADFNLGVLFQQQGNTQAALAAYRTVLAAEPAHVAAYKNIGEMLLASGQIDAWIANFRAFEQRCPNVLPLAVQALEACQHMADFANLERYLDGLRRDDFKARDDAELLDCLEELLYLLLFFDVEPSLMLRYSQAYDSVARRIHGTPMPRPASRKPGPLRVGYLSADLRNHVMGKMMWQVIAHHDRDRFELYFYSTSRERDDWTERFAAAGRRFDVIAALDDEEAAQRIAGDDLDILVDLSTHTRGARPGILARKPARVQVTHVASAGTVGLAAVDFKLTDAFADVAENQEFQIERMLVMDGCVFPFRHVAPAERHPFDRTALRIPADAVVIGAFVNPLKLSRRCLRLWRDVLERSPRARDSRSRPPIPRCAAPTCGWPRRWASARTACCSCRRGATTRRTRRATTSSTSCSTRCRSAASTERSRRSTWAYRSSRSSAGGTANARRTRSCATSASTRRSRRPGATTWTSRRAWPRTRPSAETCTSRSGAASRNPRSSTCGSTRAASRPRTCGRSPSAHRTPGRRTDAWPTRASRPSRRASRPAIRTARVLWPTRCCGTPRSRPATASRRSCCVRAPTRRGATSRRQSSTSTERSRSTRRRHASGTNSGSHAPTPA